MTSPIRSSSVRTSSLLFALTIGITSAGITSATAAENARTGSEAPAHPHMHAADGVSMVGPVAWDAAASRDLAKALHHMHEVWNSGEIESLKQLMHGDDVLVSFELDPETHKPVRLTSKREIDAFVSATVRSISNADMVTKLEMPRLNCRATATFGVCTEECTVHFMHKGSDEVIATDKLWSTAVAVKFEEGWRWIQWHMSVASAPESVEARAQH